MKVGMPVSVLLKRGIYDMDAICENPKIKIEEGCVESGTTIERLVSQHRFMYIVYPSRQRVYHCTWPDHSMSGEHYLWCGGFFSLIKAEWQFEPNIDGVFCVCLLTMWRT